MNQKQRNVQKVSNICQQKFHNIFERCCQSFKLATSRRSGELSRIKTESETTGQDVYKVNQKKTEHTKTFLLSKCQTFVNKMFQNNFERWNSACQSFNLTTLLSHIRVSKSFHASQMQTKWLVKMSKISLRVQLIFCWRFDYVMRGPIWKIDWTIFWALFTNSTILKSENFCASVFFVHLVKFFKNVIIVNKTLKTFTFCQSFSHYAIKFSIKNGLNLWKKCRRFYQSFVHTFDVLKVICIGENCQIEWLTYWSVMFRVVLKHSLTNIWNFESSKIFYAFLFLVHLILCMYVI